MTLSAKLQLKEGQPVCVLDAPEGLALGLPTTDDPTEDAILLFVRSKAALDASGEPFFLAVADDRLAWLAYPKAGHSGRI